MSDATTRLSDLCDFVGVQIDPASQTDVVYVGLEHVASGRFVRIGQGRASDVQSGKYLFRSGDVLYGKLRPYLDKAVLARDAGICTTELLVLRPKEGVDPRFLVGVVHAPTFIEHAVSGTTGVQHPRTSWSHIANYEVPAFDSREQSKIANLLWEVHDAIAGNERAIEAGGDLKRAAMRTLFTKGLRGEAQKETEVGTIPESWQVTNLGEVCNCNDGFIQTGPFGSQLHAHEYELDGIPVINPTHLVGNRIDHADLPRVSGDVALRLQRHKVAAGDILFGRRGEIGRHGFVSPTETGWLCGTGCFLVRASHPDLDNAFLSYYFSTDDVIAWLIAHAAGTIMPNLNNVVLKQLPVAYPMWEEQHEIVAILNAIDAKIDLHRRKRAVLDALFKTLLHKLMTGEIRVTDLDLSAIGPVIGAEATA